MRAGPGGAERGYLHTRRTSHITPSLPPRSPAGAPCGEGTDRALPHPQSLSTALTPTDTPAHTRARQGTAREAGVRAGAGVRQPCVAGVRYP